ncbi:sigma-70 family RNA polymerase sigma factor [Pedobacter sp. HDW13]|uniref:RNA polymerase sigma factor n=1 Tax=unclassified Pedobacter TaxID=2628915 RepID=UPI000F59D5CA|nr:MULTISPECIES: sigma-70 family RNA polymerase sigma factor [unclassified Pedobacter]QIL39399.1 sigma-70 family RNA polymerase sigma factor [Pedobacter sp. HDW13]RQO71041.1 hypothetical protein DBR40_17545 [Pedobacter sp. KBW01]
MNPLSLISDIKRGDEDAFEQAYKKWRSKGYYYFLRRTASAEDAKDLLQTTFLKLWQYRSTLNSDYSLDQQLFHIARTVLIDYIRKANKQKASQVSIETTGEAQGEPNYQSMEFDTKRRMLQILNEMPELRKKVFELHKLEGYSYKEVAAKLGITEKAVDNHLAKALRKLRSDFPLPLFLLILMLK